MDYEAMDEDSVFDENFDDESDVYSPEKKPKAKAAPKKPAAAKAAPKKLTQTTLKTKAAAKKRAKPESDEDNDMASGLGDGGSVLSNTPPSAKKQKKTAPKKASGKPLGEIENDSMAIDGPSGRGGKSKKTATETYQKLTQLEHIIKRPDTYIGSVERTEQQMWVFNKETTQMVLRKVSYVPGLYKIFDEILVNAADNKQRDDSMSYIKVTVERETGAITVENNGKGIPVEIHETEKIYIPEMVFGHLLAGSNFDDNEMKTVGGRNGYGAKLCNVFSTEFVLETQDSTNGKRYKQTWRDNMSKMEKAKITSNKSADFVRVTFKPDYDRFGMPDGIDDDLEALIYRRVYDMAGTVRGVKVHLNGNHIKLKFRTYCEMYAKAIAKERGVEEGDGNSAKVILEDEAAHRRWEIGFAVSDGSFQQVSFVNNIATTSGGTHVNYIADQICLALQKKVDKTKKGVALKLNQIRNHIFIFVNCLVNNPSFNSQTKEQLTTKQSQLSSSSKCVLTEKFLKSISATDAINDILAFAEKKADKMMAKSDGSKRSRVNNAKLVDANLAGTRHGHECTLILTEGDSAKSLAVAGRAILDPDRIGVFPLRGKLLNVRDASIDAITKNQEIQFIKQFLGLKHKQNYTDTHGLRYGHLMIMADQDHDGSHIKGLLINFLQVQFPSLLQIPEFFQEFITPIVKVWQGSNPKKPLRLKSFFTQPQYEEWKDAHRAELSRWESKYYKGLGTSSNEDAQVYFTNLDGHLKQFYTMKPDEADLFELAFSKKKADARKEWLGNFLPGTYLDHTAKSITYSDFVNKELILFSMADNMRSIPSVLDGLKPGQRKVIFACFKGNVVKDQKVAELAGYISQHTAYHHGEVSLQQTIIGLAQTFVGSNNVNCLEPSGNFGSRLGGGSDAASARYIHTRLSPFARRVFSALDEPNLEAQYDDDKKIEPKTYAPVIPMVLANGADGIGTGWSTSIPNYHPMDIVRNLRRRMGRQEGEDSEEKPFETMMPWFRGWKGTPEAAGPDRYKFNGIVYQDDKNPNEVVITELPIRTWTDDFKARLEDVIRAEKGPSFIKDYKEYNDHKNVHFIIQMEEKHMKAALEEGLLERFKLSKQVATSNLVAFDTRGQIRRYEKVEDILEEYYVYRLQMYTQRKKHWLGVYHSDYRKLKNQARFISEIIDGKLVVYRKKKQVLVQELRDRKYEAFAKGAEKKKKSSDDEDADEDDEETVAGGNDFDYLLSMPIYSLTQERLDRLQKQIEAKKAEHDQLEALSEKDLWCKDLDDFVVEWENQLALDNEIQTNIRKMGRRVSKKIGAGRGRKGKGDDEYNPVVKKAARTAAPKVTRVETKTHERFAEKFSGGLKKPAKATGVKAEADDSDNFSDDDFAALSRNKPAEAEGGRSKRAAAVKPKTYNLDSDEEEDDDAMDYKPTSTTTTTVTTTVPLAKSDDSDDDIMDALSKSKRSAAAAPTKTKPWLLSDESDTDGSRLIGDVGAMVKGIGKSDTEGGGVASGSGSGDGGRLSLFAMSTSRPESSQGTGLAGKTIRHKQSRNFDLDSFDDTNYEMLARSPQRTAGTSAPAPAKEKPQTTDDVLNSLLSDSDDDRPAVKGKAASVASSGSVLPVVKKVTKVSKASVSAAGTAKAKPASAPAVHKPLALSPAAKAYAKRQAAAKTDRLVFSGDDDSDAAVDEAPVFKPKAKAKAAPAPAAPPAPTRGRPARAAASKPVKKPIYVDSDEEDDFGGAGGNDDSDDFEMSD